MRISDYFRGYRVVMQSRLRRDELERRIRAAMVSRFRPFTEGVAGWVGLGRINLRFRPRTFEYNLGPVLAGRIDDAFGTSRLDLRYRAPISAYIALPVWCLSLVMFASLFFFGREWVDAWIGEPGLDPAIGPGFMLVCMVMPVLVHFLGTRRSDEHLDRLIGFLEKVGEASVIERDGPRPKTLGPAPGGMPAPPSDTREGRY